MHVHIAKKKSWYFTHSWIPPECVSLCVFCIPAVIKHDASVCSSRSFNSSCWYCVSVLLKGMFALYFTQTPLQPAVERSQRARRWQPLSNACVFALERHHCACGVKGRRGDEGSLGKALQVKSNYSTPPPFTRSYWISAAPPYNKSVLSFILPSSLWCCYFTLSVQLQASCEAVFPRCLLYALFTHFWLIQIVFTLGAMTVSAPHFSPCHYFPRCNFCSIIAHSSRWK